MPDGFYSFENMAITKQQSWSQSATVKTFMKRYIPHFHESQWTMKRALQACVHAHKIKFRKHDTCETLGRLIDFYKSGAAITTQDVPHQRWSAKLDAARLLQVMFGTSDARAAYIQSRQLMTRARLDDTKQRSLKVQYWVDTAAVYNDATVELVIDVGDPVVNMYLISELSVEHRVEWTATKLRENFRRMRVDHETSVELRNFTASGQNDGVNFYPDFQSKNPIHVMMHYYMLESMPHGGVLGNLPPTATADTGATVEPQPHYSPVSVSCFWKFVHFQVPV